MSQDSKPKKRIPYWLVLVIGIASTCILMNILSISLQQGVFNSWKSLNSPPSKPVQILNADVSRVMVKAGDGRVFTAALSCSGNEICHQWVAVEDESKIPIMPLPIRRGNNCETLDDGILPFNPKGVLIECAHALIPGPEMWEETYFALMSDGSVWYWQNGGSIFVTQALFIISTFILPIFVALLISLVYLIKHFISRILRRKSQANVIQAG